MKKRLYFDMDGVLVNFQSGLDKVSADTLAEYAGREDEIPGLFALMEPMPWAIEAVHELSKYYDCYILSTAPWKNPSAWSDKVQWVTKYLDDVFHKRLIITHCKQLCQGDYLIDDRPNNGTGFFTGEWIHFGSPLFPDWASVLRYLLRDFPLSEECQSVSLCTMLLQAEQDAQLMDLVRSEAIYLDEDLEYVALNEQGEHTKPASLLALERCIFTINPSYWLRDLNDLFSETVFAFKMLCRRELALSPNVVLPPREEWDNDANRAMISEILATDPSITSSHCIRREVNGHQMHMQYKSNMRMDMMESLIRDSNPAYWQDRECLLSYIARQELIRLCPSSRQFLVF